NTENKITWTNADPLLVLGNGTSEASRHNAMVVYKNGNVVAKNTSTLIGDPGIVPLPISNSGTRMMWLPQKSAFRVGTVDGNAWNADSIGTWSFASGFNARAKGKYTTAMGVNVEATGQKAVSLGEGTKSTGYASTAMGSNTLATGQYSTSLGNSTRALGENSMAAGHDTEASGENAIAMGESVKALGYASTSLGGEQKQVVIIPPLLVMVRIRDLMHL
ncbi:MAG: hypothetical protein ABIT06_00550, partial [Saprospiraceae bacterium]